MEVVRWAISVSPPPRTATRPRPLLRASRSRSSTALTPDPAAPRTPSLALATHAPLSHLFHRYVLGLLIEGFRWISAHVGPPDPRARARAQRCGVGCQRRSRDRRPGPSHRARGAARGSAHPAMLPPRRLHRRRSGCGRLCVRGLHIRRRPLPGRRELRRTTNVRVEHDIWCDPLHRGRVDDDSRRVV